MLSLRASFRLTKREKEETRRLFRRVLLPLLVALAVYLAFLMNRDAFLIAVIAAVVTFFLLPGLEKVVQSWWQRWQDTARTSKEKR